VLKQELQLISRAVKKYLKWRCFAIVLSHAEVAEGWRALRH
jgi:hypothetical protein